MDIEIEVAYESKTKGEKNDWGMQIETREREREGERSIEEHLLPLVASLFYAFQREKSRGELGFVLVQREEGCI
jgi:hypothetical protein